MARPVSDRLHRSRDERMIGGVCGGLAEYFEVDPVLMRLLFVVAALLSGGVGLLLYIVLWIITPEEGEETTPRSAMWRQNADEIGSQARRFGSDVRETISPQRSTPAETAASTSRPIAAEEQVERTSTSTPEGGAERTEAFERTSVIAPTPRPADKVERVADGQWVQRRRQTWAGILLVGLGLWLLANNLRLLWWVRADVLLPLALLGVGAWLLYSQVRDRKR